MALGVALTACDGGAECRHRGGSGPSALGADPGLALLQMELSGTANPALIAGLARASRTAFAHVFLYAGAISAFTFLASFGLKEIPLRGS